jgi:uncharacterized protein YqjF (DUF2071 family)
MNPIPFHKPLARHEAVPGCRDRSEGVQARTGGMVADWNRALFLHFAVDLKLLQKMVPYELDLHDGQAYV